MKTHLRVTKNESFNIIFVYLLHITCGIICDGVLLIYDCGVVIGIETQQKCQLGSNHVILLSIYQQIRSLQMKCNSSRILVSSDSAAVL